MYSGLAIVGGVHSPSSSSSQSSGWNKKHSATTLLLTRTSKQGHKIQTINLNDYLLGLRDWYLLWDVIIPLLIEDKLSLTAKLIQSAVKQIYNVYLWLLIFRIRNVFFVIPIFRLLSISSIKITENENNELTEYGATIQLYAKPSWPQGPWFSLVVECSNQSTSYQIASPHCQSGCCR